MSQHQQKIDDLKSKSFTGKLKFLANDAIVYGIAGALSKFLAIFLVPILTRIITKEAFGLVDAITVFNGVFCVISIFGMDSAVARFFYDTEDDLDRKKIVSLGFYSQIIQAGIISITVYFLAKPLSEFYLDSTEYVNLIEIGAGIIFSMVFLQYFQLLLKWTFQRNKFLIIALGNILANFSLTFVFVFFFDWGVEGVFYARLFSNLLFALLGLIYCRSFIVANISIDKHLKKMLAYGIPIMTIVLIPTFIPGLERYFILNELSGTYLGEYAVGIRLASLIALAAVAFNNVWRPFSLALHKEENAEETYNKMAIIYVLIMSFIGLVVVGMAKPIVMILAPENFHEAVYLVLPLTFAGIILHVCKTFNQLGISLSKKTYLSLISYLIHLVISASLIYYFVQDFELFGVVYAVLISNLILITVITFFSYQAYSIRYDLLRMSLLFVIAFGIGYIQSKTYNFELLLQIPINLGLCIAYLMIVYRIIIKKSERSLIKEKFGSKIPFLS
jgi:O-antigen/teichoic acid export membrane protein